MDTHIWHIIKLAIIRYPNKLVKKCKCGTNHSKIKHIKYQCIPPIIHYLFYISRLHVYIFIPIKNYFNRISHLIYRIAKLVGLVLWEIRLYWEILQDCLLSMHIPMKSIVSLILWAKCQDNYNSSHLLIWLWSFLVVELVIWLKLPILRKLNYWDSYRLLVHPIQPITVQQFRLKLKSATKAILNNDRNAVLKLYK